MYAEEGQWSGQEPFVLSINYLRDLKGAAIAERSIDEIRQQGYSNEDNLQRWLLSLQTILPDVSKNTRINGVKTSDNATVFYKNDQYLGAIHDPLFTQVFFDIWLGEKTSQPKLRKDLLGGNL